jgi:hypothetical protein
VKIEVVGADHQNKPDLGSNILRRWIDTGKVDVIVDVVALRRSLWRQSNAGSKHKRSLKRRTGANPSSRSSAFPAWISGLVLIHLPGSSIGDLGVVAVGKGPSCAPRRRNWASPSNCKVPSGFQLEGQRVHALGGSQSTFASAASSVTYSLFSARCGYLGYSRPHCR